MAVETYLAKARAYVAERESAVAPAVRCYTCRGLRQWQGVGVWHCETCDGSPHRAPKVPTHHTSVYGCPVCRQWVPCLAREAWEEASQQGRCAVCVGTDNFRLQCHIARIEASITNADDTPGGSIKAKAQVVPDSQRDVYRRLWRKRERQLAAAWALLERFSAAQKAQKAQKAPHDPKDEVAVSTASELIDNLWERKRATEAAP